MLCDELMKAFLYELAEKMYRTHGRKLEHITIVFPNRRASLYFRKHLSSLLDKPTFSPRLITIEEFIGSWSPLQIPDKLDLIHRMYHVYFEVLRDSEGDEEPAEPFDQFYFWGDMLLRDFDEVDKYMVRAHHLFQDLSQQKELDALFDFLTPEQLEFLKSFWSNFQVQDSATKRKFLYIWRQLPAVYQAFRARLRQEGLAYEGMLHREVAEALRQQQVDTHKQITGPLYFVGFNALTKAEEIILGYFVEHHQAEMVWDMDAYYFHNQTQEAGRYFREYQAHTTLGKTFGADVPANFLRATQAQQATKTIHLYGAAQPVGQAKLMAQVLLDQVHQGLVPEDTLVVLPDEKLLMPVLHGIAPGIDKLNVTMGFPLGSTPLFNLMELLMELQIQRKSDYFNHRGVLALLGHPYIVAADPGAANIKRRKIMDNNWVFIPKSYLATEVPLHRLVFEDIGAEQQGEWLVLPGVSTYLKDIVQAIGTLPAVTDFDREYCFHFLRLLNRMDEVVGRPQVRMPEGELSRKAWQTLEREAYKSFLRLFRQLLKAEKIPFTGEPLRGLQVMGVLETRNLDYKNVYILSLNEGAFPSFNAKGSYIPFNIRKAYGLPTPDHQDAIYAYLFYRVLQRAENIHLFYNSETDVLGQGEMSRYLQQLIFESGLTIQKHVLHNTMAPSQVTPIVIQKDARVFEALARHHRGESFKTLSPTALNDYIECRLRFYFKHVARIREAREVEEDLDARVLGNFLHEVMEHFYREILDYNHSKEITPDDLRDYNPRVDRIIDQVFIDAYQLDPDKPVIYEGQRLVVREVVKRFVDRIVAIDRAYAPFTIEALERKDLMFGVPLDTEGNPEVMIGGAIDRADLKGQVLRVIDYKTGKDELSFESITALFNREGKRNKAAFQTILYALLFYRNVTTPGTRLVPGLMNRVNLFDDDFVFGLKQGRSVLHDVTPLFPEFEMRLKQLLEELYNPHIPFDQTPDVETCMLCAYKSICYRQS